MFLPMILAAIEIGWTFRLDIMAPEKQIIKSRDITQHLKVIENPSASTSYKMIESMSDVFDFLEVQGELALYLKGNNKNLNISGNGDYLTQQIDRTKVVELLFKVDIVQSVETLPTYARLVKDWEKLKNDYNLGDHYIRSLVYGGRMLVSVRITSNTAEKLEQIKAVVKANIGVEGSVSADLEGKLEKISKNLHEVSKTEVFTYFSGGMFDSPRDIASAFKLMEDFPKEFDEYTKKSENNKKILYFELEPLKTLNHNFEMPVPNKINNAILDEAIDKYDDICFAKTKLNGWFPEDYSNEKLGDDVEVLKRNLTRAKNAMDKAINALDLSKSFDKTAAKAFEDAFEAYAAGGANIPNKYTLLMQQYKNEDKKIVPPWYPYTRAINTYIHWGNVNCSLPSPEPEFIGVAAGAPKGFASGSDIQCLEPTPSLLPLGATPKEFSEVNGLTYQTPENTYGALLCARCVLENATSVFTVPAKKHCPGDTKLEYEGFLATGNMSVTTPICIHRFPVSTHHDIHVKADPKANSLVPMRIRCPTCPFESEDVRYVPCVVCSR